MIDYCKNAVALEIGPHRSEKVFDKYSKVIIQTLINLDFIEGSKRRLNQKFFKYIGDKTITRPDYKKLKNFKLIKKGELIGNSFYADFDFYPFLINARSRTSTFMCAQALNKI